MNSSYAQDSLGFDYVHLNSLSFYKKYSFYDSKTTQQDIQVTKSLWALEQVRKDNSFLRSKGVPTYTLIEDRPDGKNPYYIIGHYQAPTRDKMTRMSAYRIDTLRRTIDYQSWDNMLKEKWIKIK